MTINIFVLKGNLNEKIVMVRFFFCRVYIIAIQKRQSGLLYESAKFVISTSRSHV